MKRLGILMIAALAAACAGLYGGGTRQGVSSSLVDYLYPQGEVPPRQEGVIPHLQIPLAVGLAFVPAQSPSGNVLPEAERLRLLNDVKAAFGGRDYIREIAVIPDAYMRSGRGFESLEQTARLYGLDVMALVSYDQVTHTSEKKSSLLYWTIVGAYFVEGNKNDVQTFVDTAVIDVATRKLLFRAPGTSEHKSDSTLVEVERDLRARQQKGFETAMADMTVNLDKELATFRERIKTDGSVRVTRTGGAETGGGGTTHPALLALLVLLSTLARRSTR
jgi:rhombotail lipoprotein